MSPAPESLPPAGIRASVRRLIAARAARSVGQGALVAAFTLYLHALGWQAPAIGAVLSATLLVGAAVTLVAGPAGDRFLARRGLLLGYEWIQIAAACIAFASARPWVLSVAAVAGGFGRGANGSAGPFGPLEQAWLAQLLPARTRGRLYSLNAAIGFAGMGLGALLASGVGWLLPIEGVAAYRWLFLLSLLGSLVAYLLLRGARELPRDPAPAPQPPARRRRENALLRRLMLTNALNGFGIGMIGPIAAYWFALRFARGPGLIGPALAASFLCAAVGALLARRLVRRHGIVPSVVAMRLLGLLLLLVIPFAESFWLAAGCYALRSGLNRGTAGARQALVSELTGDERRGFAASVQNVSLQIPRALGPLLSALLIHLGDLRAPFLIAAVFQGTYLALYARFFREFGHG